jgi:Domain of unknown function (DUF5658)
MLRRFFATAGIIVWSGCSWGVAVAQAQDLASPLANAMPKLTFATSVTAPAAMPIAPEAQSTIRPSFDYGSHAFKTLLPFYASTAALQILDVRSTLQVIKLGGSEGNPMLRGLAAHPAMFVGVKAAVAAVSIYSAQRLAKHSRVGAIATMVALNSVYAMVVAHNYQVARSMR